jgi:ABC-2 type transport system permease protein
MKKIAAIILKDIRLRFSSKAEWLFFLILPIVFTVVLAGGTGNSGSSKNKLLVVDQAGSLLSQELVNQLKVSPVLEIQLLSLDQAEQAFKDQQGQAVLVIPQSLDLAQLSQGAVDVELREQPNDVNALSISQTVQAAVARIRGGVEIARQSTAEAEQRKAFENDAARQTYFEEAYQAAQTQMDQAPSRVAEVIGATRDPDDYDPRANSSAGQLITWVFIPLLGISGTFAFERQKGTLGRLLTTPTEKATFLIGTISGQVLVALFQMLLLVGFGILVLKVHWGQSPAALLLMMLASALAAAALGTTMGTFIKTEGQANGLSTMMGMVMALLGGCWYPLEMFPQVVQNVVKVLPTTWAMQGMLNIVLRGGGLVEVLPAVGVLTAFALVFFGVGVARFRYE